MGISMKTTERLNICDIIKPLFYSGFALTDNSNFIEFYVKKFPKLNQEFKEFVFNENTLSFELGGQVKAEEQKKSVFFDDFILDNKIFYHYFIAKYKEMQFYWLNRWMGQKRAGLIAIVKDGKLIGLLKTKKRRTENGNQIEEKRGKEGRKENVSKRKTSSKKD